MMGQWPRHPPGIYVGDGYVIKQLVLKDNTTGYQNQAVGPGQPSKSSSWSQAFTRLCIPLIDTYGRQGEMSGCL